ncbi:MAG: helix-turn-helix domain-containing protein [Candidatus Dormiibacterota bacterium]
MASVKSRRPYRSRLRAEQAAQTRLRILDAAGELFAEGGYAATTIDAVAARASVAVDTVYAVFGTKRGLLSALIDHRVMGSAEGSDVLAGEGPRALQTMTDREEMIAAFAADIAARIERVRPIDDVMRGAAAIDPDIAELRARMQENRFNKLRYVVELLAAIGPLRGGVDVDDAAAIVWTLTSPEVNRLLRDDRGWSTQRYEQWLSTTLWRVLIS